MSTIEVKNIHFESTANNKISYEGGDSTVFYSGGGPSMILKNKSMTILSTTGTASYTNNFSNEMTLYTNDGTTHFIDAVANSNFVLNITANSSTTLESTMANNNFIKVSCLVAMGGGNTHHLTGIKVDGNPLNSSQIFYKDGIPPANTTHQGVDEYIIRIQKLASPDGPAVVAWLEVKNFKPVL
jgi:hypothetical protein